MTGKRRPLRDVARVMVSRYGDDGPWTVYLGLHSPFVADPSQAPPPTLADRYTATATGSPPDLLSLIVTDRETGATVELRDGRVLLTAEQGVSSRYVGRIWKDAQQILGLARRGRPPGTTTIRDDGQILKVIAELQRAGRKVTLETIGTNAGSFSYNELRGYLDVNGKRLHRGAIVPRK